MSHFTVAVFIDGDNTVDDLLAPYAENLPVESYTEDGHTYFYNPNAKWDWYEIGGRWSQYFRDIGIDPTGIRVGDIQHAGVEFTTFAVVLPDGEWHEVGSMGWWGNSSETAEERLAWEKNYMERFIKSADPDWILHILDCHI